MEVQMISLKKISRRKPKGFESQLQRMDNSVKSHPAWICSTSLLEGQALLEGHSPFTYALSAGVDKYHYYLQYVGVDKKAHFKNVRIRYENGAPIYRNGTGTPFSDIDELVPACLKCSPSICKPVTQ